MQDPDVVGQVPPVSTKTISPRGSPQSALHCGSGSDDLVSQYKGQTTGRTRDKILRGCSALCATSASEAGGTCKLRRDFRA